MKWTFLTALGVTAICAGFRASPAVAQDESAERIRSVRDGVYTAEQADRGEAVFQQECGICHSPSEFGGPGFLRGWDGRTADRLFRLIMNTMPLDSPGRLEADEYAAVISYLLKLNGLPAGEAELPSDVEELGRIRIESGADSGLVNEGRFDPRAAWPSATHGGSNRIAAAMGFVGSATILSKSAATPNRRARRGVAARR